MTLIVENKKGNEQKFDNFVSLERDGADLLVQLSVDEHATRWERVVEGTVTLIS